MNKAAQKEAIKAGANPILTGLKANISNIPYNSAVMANRLNTGIMRRAEGFNNSLMGGFGNFVNSHPFLSIAGLEGANLFLGNPTNKSEDSGGVDVTQANGSQPIATGNTGGYSGSGGYGGGLSGTLAAGNSVTGNITPEQLNNIVKSTQGYEGSGYGSGNPMQLYSNYMLRQQAMQPYRDELNNYIRDYRRYSDWAYNQDKHLALLSALTGAQGLNQMIGKYTALGDEEKLAALKKVQGEDYKNIGDQLAQMQGNIALARKMGLPLESVNASDNMLRLAMQDQMNDDRLENRLALAQYNATVRQKLQEERFRFQQAIKAGNRKVAQQSAMKMSEYYKALQAMRLGATPEDIYRTTGKKIYVSNPQQLGQTFKDL
jgi:hypothetical protein